MFGVTDLSEKVGERPQQRVLMTLMPFAPPIFPGLGPALLRTILNRDGIPCDIIYGNLVFTAAIASRAVHLEEFATFPIAELAFTPYYFDSSADEAVDRLWRFACERSRSPEKIEDYEWLVTQAGVTLDMMLESIAWERYDVVGMSVMMQQTVPSLALARRIKREHPHMHIVFGGPNCSWPMGEEFVRSFPEIDAVVEGEADGVIGPLVRDLRAGVEPTSPGVSFRTRDGEIRRTGPGGTFNQVNSLPVPDYGPFFDQLKALAIDHVMPYLQMETSRGCWWGQKHHCTFCSLEDALMEFRAKTEERVLTEIMELARRHEYTEFFPTDSIINHRFYKTLLPQIARMRAESGLDLAFFFEVKSNLRREHATALRAAGVNTVQPGIESFSDHILHLMDKGSTAVRQVQCLKSLAESRIVANWNLIYRNPNETVEDYRDILAALPFLHHLPPMHHEGLTPMLLLRFSPYFENPDAHGIEQVRPAPFYEEIFPDPSIDLEKIAYYFEFDHPDHANEELKRLHLELADALDVWRRCYRKDSLVQVRGPGFVRVIDVRVDPDADEPYDEEPTVTILEGARAELFVYCDQVRSQPETIRTFEDRMSAGDISTFLDEMVAQRLIYRSPAGQLINLPLVLDVQERANAMVLQAVGAA